jgi:hypothetical protein
VKRQQQFRRSALIGAVGVALILGLAVCAPSSAPPVLEAISLRSAPTPRPVPTAVATFDCATTPSISVEAWQIGERTYPLRGDPDFQAALLDREARYWYDRLWDAISAEEAAAAVTAQASADNLYTYGRGLHTHILSLLTAFRVTGDLALLDEVDRLAEHMRGQLRDAWRATRDGSNGTRDGFVNWVDREEGGSYRGKDLVAFNEMRSHALVAQMAWAFHLNRDLPSPNGVDYAQRAQVWTAYLMGHFEPKWRQREAVRAGEFPFLQHPSLHATVAFIKYHHYLGMILESEPHAQEARRLSELVLQALVTFDVQGELAVVWPGRVGDDDDGENLLNRTTYARYVVGDLIDLHLDGAASWREPWLPAALAVTVRELVFVVDGDDLAFAIDVGGGEPHSELEPHDPEEFSEFTSAQYFVSGLALAAGWDTTAQVTTWTCRIFEERSSRGEGVHLPAALLLVFGQEYMSSRLARQP